MENLDLLPETDRSAPSCGNKKRVDLGDFDLYLLTSFLKFIIINCSRIQVYQYVRLSKIVGSSRLSRLALFLPPFSMLRRLAVLEQSCHLTKDSHLSENIW
jgi:hypothetical protein